MKHYEIPEIEIIQFSSEDAITNDVTGDGQVSAGTGTGRPRSWLFGEEE